MKVFPLFWKMPFLLSYDFSLLIRWFGYFYSIFQLWKLLDLRINNRNLRILINDSLLSFLADIAISLLVVNYISILIYLIFFLCFCSWTYIAFSWRLKAILSILLPFGFFLWSILHMWRLKNVFILVSKFILYCKKNDEKKL